MTRFIPGLLVATLLAAAPAFAQDPCEACLNQAGAEGNKCQSVAKAPGESLACDKQFSSAHRACAAAACKGKPQAQQSPCSDCKKFVKGETDRCLKDAKAPDKDGCRNRGAEMAKSCDQRFCSADVAKKPDPAKKPEPVKKPEPAKKT